MNLRQRIGAAFNVLRGKSERSYKAAQVNRLTLDWIGSTLEANEEIRRDQRTLRARARELAKNNPYVGQYLKLLVNNVIGPNGFTMQAQVRNNDGRLSKQINDRIELAFAEWSKAPGVKPGSLRHWQRLALRNVAVDGECFVAMYESPNSKYGIRIDLIDADRVDWEYNDAGGNGKPRIIMGIEVDSEGRPAAYHVFSSHPSSHTRDYNVRQRIPARNVLHLYDPVRVDQMRGVSWMSAAAYGMNMLDGYVEAELVAARTGAAKMGWFQWRDGADIETFDPHKDTVNMEANPGSIGFAPPGTEFVPWSPDHPSAAFPAFTKQILRQCAAALGVSYNALANDLEGVNYSSIRSGLLIERDNWRDLQQWWIEWFLQPVYDRWLESALMTGGLTLDSRDPARFREVRWMGRGWAWVDPLKDAQAAILQIQNGLETRTNLLAEKGTDFEDVIEKLAAEETFIADAGLKLGTPAPAAGGAQEKDPEDETDDDDEEETADRRQPVNVNITVPRDAFRVENNLPSILVKVPTPTVNIDGRNANAPKVMRVARDDKGFITEVQTTEGKRTVAIRDASGHIVELREVENDE